VNAEYFRECRRLRGYYADGADALRFEKIFQLSAAGVGEIGLAPLTGGASVAAGAAVAAA